MNDIDFDDVQFYHPGDIVEILDQVDLETTTIATVKFVEPDNEIDGLQWLYLVANEVVLNNKTDPKFPFLFWRLIANTESEYITLIERPM